MSVLSMERLVETMGGAEALEREVRSDLELMEIVERGLPVKVLDRILSDGLLSKQEVFDFVISQRSLDRRRKESRRLSPEESDALVRAMLVLTRALEVFGSLEHAQEWLRHPLPIIGGRRPLSLVKTEVGFKTLETVLGRIEHGIYS